jgi:flagellin
MSFGSISSTAAAAQSPLEQLQNQILQTFSRASSGKRINTAADDPSGLAISETITAQANAFTAASQNVSDAKNALTVADGALQTTSDSLGALSTLAVAATNDFLSPSDRANLQTVANQLVQQINTDAATTNFNGTALLNGQFSGPTPAVAASSTVTSNATLSSGGNLVQAVSTSPNAQAGTIAISVVNTGSGTAVQTSFTDSATGQTTVQSTVVQPNSSVTVNGTTIALGSFGSGDVSDSAVVQVAGAQAAGTAASLNVQSGANEGATTNFTLPNGSSSGLFIGDLDLSSSQSATNSQGQINAALESVNNARATLGAQVVSGEQQINNDNTASNNLVASASNIADQNTAAISTELTKLRIQQQISIATLANANDQFGFLNRFFNSPA